MMKLKTNIKKMNKEIFVDIPKKKEFLVFIKLGGA